MPQIFQVLRCFKCSVFQVHQTKKSNKFKCKLCGENQSIKRHYGIGTAKDCRLHVQKLNGIRQEIDELNSSIISDSSIPSIDQDDTKEEIQLKTISPKRSKWSQYAEIDDDGSKDRSGVECNETMMLGEHEVVLEIPKKKFKRPPPSKLKGNSNLNNVSIQDTHTEDMWFNTKSNSVDNSIKENLTNIAKNSTQVEGMNIPKYVNISKLTATTKTLEKGNLSESKCNQVKESFQICNGGRPSKWEKFVDSDTNEEEPDNVLESSQNVNCQKDLDTLFSLSDNYDDLNELLDF